MSTSNALIKHTFTEDGLHYLYPFVRTDCIFFPKEDDESGIDRQYQGGAAISKCLQGESLINLNSIGVSSGTRKFTFGAFVDEEQQARYIGLEMTSDKFDIESIYSSTIKSNDVLSLLVKNKLILGDDDDNDERGIVVSKDINNIWSTCFKSNILVPSTSVNLSDSSVEISGSSVSIKGRSSVIIKDNAVFGFDSTGIANFYNTPNFYSGLKVHGGRVAVGVSAGVDISLTQGTEKLKAISFNCGDTAHGYVNWSGSVLSFHTAGTINLFNISDSQHKALLGYDSIGLSKGDSYINMSIDSGNNSLLKMSGGVCLSNSGHGIILKQIISTDSSDVSSRTQLIVSPSIAGSLRDDVASIYAKSTGSSDTPVLVIGTINNESNVKGDIKFRTKNIDISGSIVNHGICYLSAGVIRNTYTYGAGTIPNTATRILIPTDGGEFILNFPKNSIPEGQIVIIHGRRSNHKVTINYEDNDNDSRKIVHNQSSSSNIEFTTVLVGMKRGGNDVCTFLVSDKEYD